MSLAVSKEAVTRWPAAQPRGMESHLLPSAQEGQEPAAEGVAPQELLGHHPALAPGSEQHDTSSSGPAGRPGRPFILRGKRGNITRENLYNLPEACHMAASHRGTVIRSSLSAFNKALKMTEHFSIGIF